jgi:hypothetical protein
MYIKIIDGKYTKLFLICNISRKKFSPNRLLFHSLLSDKERLFPLTNWK